MRLAVVGYEENYEVSDDGNVFSVKRNKPLAKIVMQSGYVYVHLHKNGKSKLHRLHRVVAEAFIPNPDGLPIVNHKDGNKKNCASNNLEWCTASQNMMHAIGTGLVKDHGEDNPSAKLTAEQVKSIRREYIRGSKTNGTVALAKKYGVSNVMIGKIIRNENWKTI